MVHESLALLPSCRAQGYEQQGKQAPASNPNDPDSLDGDPEGENKGGSECNGHKGRGGGHGGPTKGQGNKPPRDPGRDPGRGYEPPANLGQTDPLLAPLFRPECWPSTPFSTPLSTSLNTPLKPPFSAPQAKLIPTTLRTSTSALFKAANTGESIASTSQIDERVAGVGIFISTLAKGISSLELEGAVRLQIPLQPSVLQLQVLLQYFDDVTTFTNITKRSLSAIQQNGLVKVFVTILRILRRLLANVANKVSPSEQEKRR
ncbi:hypothetical protein MBM_10013 [Drepanopeziza brunnea f. sp. 'multigermtubi' MB_m1]|uniref:Uncharacterized protein n=1 Tax=Marssonina brunnea f. sp. multigermtubi (strain MB_m1) TaxID=1072389 RepID=K1XH94_MARBU|nr:uncharacterized protein MBM_10013 [Drepanopeziza brunnea f. sp. 'multigermtubi' MB_m1]EKD11844.1 hypothetical protein MBM_10013 [Drepanopeziza brunnea f. sp. 'multigermtubi' MB_m1]